jgi:hypothetical protein
MDAYLSLSDIAKSLGRKPETIRDWYVRSKRIVKPKKINGKILGWNLKYLRDHSEFGRVFHSYKVPKKKAPTKKKNPPKLFRAKNFKDEVTGYSHPINCAEYKPIYKKLMQRILNHFRKPLKQYVKPVCVVVVFDDLKFNGIRKLKRKLNQLANNNSCKHITKHENSGGVICEHYHVAFIFDAVESNVRSDKHLRSLICGLVNDVGADAYVDGTNQKEHKGIHIVQNDIDKEDFIYHISYFAKSRTTVRGLKSLYTSR